MNKIIKNKISKMSLILACSTILLSACNNTNDDKKMQSEKDNHSVFAFTPKETKYKKDDTTEVLIDSEIKKEDIVKVIKHGDHWHVFTKDGKEHITYVDPSKIDDKGSIELVSVVSKNMLKGMNVVSIKKHGDHWHVYTSDGQEFLTYENPSSLFPNIVVGVYVGSHSSFGVADRKSGFSISTKSIDNNEDRVIKILQHGDHWHIYTLSGKEFISYTDPREKYPNAEFGQYVGNHGDDNSSKTISNDKPKNSGKQDISNDSNEDLGLVTVVNDLTELKKLDLKEIKLHGDHYHLYTKNGKEYITYNSKVKDLFPHIKIKNYDGNHSDTQNDKQIKWPKGVTRIVDHGDHWHLYIGDKEVGVVRENPKSHYPNAEYIDERDENSNIELNDSEIFSYNSITPKLIEKVIPYLDDNLKAMRGFGNLNTNLPVYGSNGVTSSIFYWLHGNHYHAITIKQIIQNAKANKYGPCTAKEVVATLKYIIQNPNVDIEVKENIDRDEVKKYLREVYDIKEKLHVWDVGSTITVQKNGEFLYFNLTEFEMKDGKVRYKKELPKFPKKEDKVNNEKKDNIIVDNKIVDKKNENKIEKDKKKFEDNDLSKEKQNLEKLSKILGIDKDEVIDRIYEVITDQNPRVSDLIVNNDGTVIFNGKTYNLKN